VGVAAELGLAETSIFAYLTQHTVEMQILAQAMSSFSAQIAAAVADAYDFSEIRTLADIGGSHGMVLALILAGNPAMRGILFDLPGVIGGSSDFLKSRDIHHRIDLKSGNFFESVPEGADAYLLKHVLRDWSDENCMQSPAGAEVSASDARAFVENCMAIIAGLSSELDKLIRSKLPPQIVDCRNHFAGEIEPPTVDPWAPSSGS
jgi:O-methyltransferase domain